MRAGPQTREPALMRGWLARPAFLRAKRGTDQCGAG